MGCSVGGFDTHEVALCGTDKLRGIIAQDFNGDGNDDVAVGCKTRSDPLTGQLEVWVSDAAGKLAQVQSLELGTFSSGGEGAGPITAADFNEDGYLDLVVVDTGGTTHGVSMLYGEENARFGEPTYYERLITWIASSDVNGDGHEDLIPVLRIGGRYIPGDGGEIDPSGPDQLMSSQTHEYGRPQRVDFNGDGRSDAVIPRASSGRLLLFPSAEKAYDLVMGKSVRQVQDVLSGARLDADDAPDLLLRMRNDKGQQEFRWLLTEEGPKLSAPIARLPADARRIQTADFNGDGIPDLLLDQGYQPEPKYHGAARPFIYMGKPDGGYEQAIVLDLPGSPGQKILADFNGDGKSDFLYSKITEDAEQGVVYLSQW